MKIGVDTANNEIPEGHFLGHCSLWDDEDLSKKSERNSDFESWKGVSIPPKISSTDPQKVVMLLMNILRHYQFFRPLTTQTD
jgi:hypothetical protein